MKKFILYILSAYFGLSAGCEKYNPEIIPEAEVKSDAKTYADSLYPTTIKKLDTLRFIELRNEYLRNNSYILSSINEFGFCGIIEDDFKRPLKNIPDTSVTREQAIEIAGSFISENSK